MAFADQVLSMNFDIWLETVYCVMYTNICQLCILIICQSEVF